MINDVGELEDGAQPLASVAMYVYVSPDCEPHKLSNKVSVPDMETPSITYGSVPPENEINSDALQSPKHWLVVCVVNEFDSSWGSTSVIVSWSYTDGCDKTVDQGVVKGPKNWTGKARANAAESTSKI